MAPSGPTATPDSTAVASDNALRRLLERMLSRLLRETPLKWRVNFTVTMSHEGKSFRVPIIYGRGFQNLGISEPWLFKALQRVMGPRAGVCVDVGVNLGQTLIKAKLIDPNRPYIGFEPNPQCSQYATELIRVNGFRDCQVIPVGLSNNTQVATLFAKEDAVDTSASVVPGFRRTGFYQRTQSVPLFRGDDLLADLDDMAVLKVDVEGGELEVIGGLRETIVRLQPHIFCEVLPVFDATTDVGAFRQRRQTELIRQLHTLGYVMFRMLASGGAVELADIDVHRDMALTNYAFVPADAAPEFRRDFSFANRPATG